MIKYNADVNTDKLLYRYNTCKKSLGPRILSVTVSLAECSFVPEEGFHIHNHGMPQEAPRTPTRGPKTHQSRRKTPLRRIQDAISAALGSQKEAKLGAQEPPTAALLGALRGASGTPSRLSPGPFRSPRYRVRPPPRSRHAT